MRVRSSTVRWRMIFDAIMDLLVEKGINGGEQ